MKSLKLLAVAAVLAVAVCGPEATQVVDEPEEGFIVANIEVIADVADQMRIGDELEITADPRIIALAEDPALRSLFDVTAEIELVPGVMLYSSRLTGFYRDQEPGDGEEEPDHEPDCVMEDFDRVGIFKRTSRWTGFGLCMERAARAKCGSIWNADFSGHAYENEEAGRNDFHGYVTCQDPN